MTQKKPQTQESKTLKKLEDMRAGFSGDTETIIDLLDEVGDRQFEATDRLRGIAESIESIAAILNDEAKLLKRFLIGWGIVNFTLAIVVIALLASK